eukprot:TRINITY_DN27982_c0_g1_i1.p1 TRINITY_DN27982_c0_g1~~TRINITY_DN27982_c0_g1_i1.p1  ORF type:complete len:1575 (+),score=273.60 TRINITY_DN27982_c0_g1_i1:585-4727(+)
MQLQQAELLSKGIDIMTDVKRLTFAYNQNKIVEDVESGYADIGFVRTDMIDRAVALNRTSWDKFEVLNKIDDPDFPFARSTKFTPEWPIGSLSHVPDQVSERIAIALMALDRSSQQPSLAEPALKGHFDSWVPPMNYFRLLDMLQNIGVYNREQRQCLRSADVYQAISCPKGFVKQSAEHAFCTSGCKEGYTCLCNPCSKLRDPELVLQAHLVNTTWAGVVDMAKVHNTTVLAESCSRMSSCGTVVVGQRLTWVLLDQIGETNRRAINAPLIDSVRVRFGIDSPWQTLTMENITTHGFQTQQYSLEWTAKGEGTHMLQVHINCKEAEMSPVVVSVVGRPLQDIHCPPGHGLDEDKEDGICKICRPGTVSLGGHASVCRPCGPGTAQSLQGKLQCEACPVGKVQANEASSECELCPPGRSSRGKTGSERCSPCEPGQEAPSSGSERCVACPRGRYSETDGTERCVVCGNGQSTKDMGSSSSDSCVCMTGQYLKGSKFNSTWLERCTTCPPGLNCPGGNGPPLQLPGYWAETLDADAREYSVFKCRDEFECPGKSIGTCADGRGGRACNNCEAWHHDVMDGRCEPCQNSHSLPLILLLLVAAFTVAALFCFGTAKLSTQSTDQMTLMLTAGQLIMMFQTMSAIRYMDIHWEGPAKWFIGFLSVFSLDLDILSLGCVFASDGPLLKISLQLLVYPMFLAGLLLVWWCSKRCLQRRISGDAIINMSGVVAIALFMTLTLIALLPFQCTVSPNDTYTMVTQPGVICYTSTQHWFLVCFAIVGIAMYPVTIISTCVYATLKHPSYIRSGQGLLIVGRYRFLFQRFSPERYYYGVLYLGRNAVLTLIPTVAVSWPGAQIVCMTIVLLTSMIAQIRLWPWRTRAANISEMLFVPSVILFLASAAPMVDFKGHRERHTALLSWMLCIVCLLMLVALLAAISATVWRLLRPTRRFKAFICHQKSTAGSLARFVKLMIGKHSTDHVFLDSDQLHDLDTLFDTVRCWTQNVVVLLTPEVLTRPWCVGEVATAWSNGVPIVLVSCNGSRPLSAASMEAVMDSWTESERQLLLNFGIDMPLVKNTAEHLQGLPTLSMPRFGELEEQENSVLQLMATCHLRRRPFMEKARAGQDASVLILGHTAEAEVLSTCMVLQTLLQRMLQQVTCIVRTDAELKDCLVEAKFAVVVLSRGILESPVFAKMLLETLAYNGWEASQDSCPDVLSMRPHKSIRSACSNRSRASSVRSRNSRRQTDTNGQVKMITVNADLGFEFPSEEFYKRLDEQGLDTQRDASLSGQANGQVLHKAYQHLLRRIALPLSSYGAESLIEHQVDAIKQRIDTCEMGVTRKLSFTPHSTWTPFARQEQESDDEEQEIEEEHRDEDRRSGHDDELDIV